MSALYPDVPLTLGVPSVLRDLTNPGTGTDALLTQDSADVGQLAAQQWGIFKDGGAVLEADNVIAVNYRAEYRIADYPIEQGGFESYDKVAMPFDAVVRMTKGGALADRTAFLASLTAMQTDREIYDVVTAEATYASVNVAHVTVDRSAESGAGLIVADVGLIEIRQNATAKFSKTKDAASADTVNNGPTQATSAPANPGTVK